MTDARSVDRTEEKYLGGEVVGVTVEKSTAGVCALGIVFINSGLGTEEWLVDDGTLPVLELSVESLHEIARYDYLVEKIPDSFIAKGADPVIQNIPEWIVKSVGGNFVLIANSAERPGTRLVERIIIKVTHHNNALIGIDSPQRVGNASGETPGSFAQGTRLSLPSKSRRPMVDNKTDRNIKQ